MSADAEALPRPEKSIYEVIVDDIRIVFDDDKAPPELFYLAGGIFASTGGGFLYRCFSNWTIIGIDLSVFAFIAAFVCFVLGRHVEKRRQKNV
jgi:hypothetical protein